MVEKEKEGHGEGRRTLRRSSKRGQGHCDSEDKSPTEEVCGMETQSRRGK